MKIIKVISEHKKRGNSMRYTNGKSPYKVDLPKAGYKRVEAIIEENGFLSTKHIDVKI